MKPRDLRLRFDDVDWRERSLRHLPLVAVHLFARLGERVSQDDEVAGGKGEIPIRLFDERQLVHHDLGELRVGEVDGAAGDENVATVQVDGPAAQERLHVRAGQRRWKLRVEPRELVAGVEARPAEVDGVASACPRCATGQANAAVDLGPLEPAFRRAADRRGVGADVPLVSKVRDDSRVIHALEDQHVLPRDVGVEPRDRDVVVLLERHPDRVGQGNRQRRA